MIFVTYRLGVMGYLLILMLLQLITSVNFVVMITREVIPFGILLSILLLLNSICVLVYVKQSNFGMFVIID